MKRALGRAGVVLTLLLTSVVTIPAANAATVYSFTNAGATSLNGPTQSQINSAYSGTSLAGRVTISTQGLQRFTVPSAGRYQIEVAGSIGGSTSVSGGAGARFTSNDVTLSAGEILRIGVGQIGMLGSPDTTGSGGGGASWVYRESNTTLLAIAGGGGGGGVTGVTNANATAENNSVGNGLGGSESGGTLANGGTAGGGGTNSGNNCGLSGAGWTGNGPATATCGRAGGSSAIAISSTAVGGSPDTGTGAGAFGGFGGGGGGGGSCGYGGGGGGYSGGGGGSYGSGCGGPGGAGGSYSTIGFNWVGTNAAVGFVKITSLGPSLTTFAPRTTLTNSSSITYDITFSETVTGLATGDFSKSGGGSTSCTIGSPSGSGTTYTIQLSGCSPGTVILTMASGAATNTSSQTAPSTNTAAATVTIDQTAPTISTVNAPANKTYIPSETPTFTMAFSESVTVTGTPRLTLTVGAITKYATFVSLTDSKTATFRYTVASGATEFDTDGIAVATSLDLNGGAIADLATNSIVDRSFSAPILTSVLVAQPAAAPTIDSITATSGTLTVYFTPGAARGSTVTNYQYATNGSTFKVRSSVSTASPLVISTISTGETNLVNGTGYTIRILAVTNAGNSDASAAVVETPTAVIVSGDATLTLTYGNSASTSAYSANGGTGSYTWSLGSSISGVTLSGTTVTASSSTPVGTYSQTVRATDGNSQVGVRGLTITVNKATTSISISLPGSATTAAASGAVTITASVSRAGSVNFQLGGVTISGCASSAAASTTATCSWTAPNTLGSVSLSAIFTPTDTSNFETSTSTTLTISIVNGVSTLSISLAGGVTSAPKGQAILITATIDQAGRVTFTVDGKKIPGCINRLNSIGNATCSWKPAVQKAVTIRASLNPTNNVYQGSNSSMAVQVVRRTGTR